MRRDWAGWEGALELTTEVQQGVGLELGTLGFASIGDGRGSVRCGLCGLRSNGVR